jgi:hypothetical protein
MHFSALTPAKEEKKNKEKEIGLLRFEIKYKSFPDPAVLSQSARQKKERLYRRSIVAVNGGIGHF